MNKTGTLYGIGVGPGDPDLMTFKAADTANRADVIFAASNERNKQSLALEIARPHLAEGKEIITAPFPHTFDSVDGRSPHAKVAAEILKVLKRPASVAFLTLGDPMTYSTFSYVLEELRKMEPALNVEVVPGVTSFAAAAASAVVPLAEGDERLTIIGAARVTDTLEEALDAADNLVVMKPYRNAERVCDILDERGVGDDTWFCAEVSRETELVVRSTSKAREALGRYMSLFLVKNRSGAQG